MATEEITYDSAITFPDPIARARALRDLVEQHRGEYTNGCGQDYRDWLVQRLSLPISGMTLDRYLRLLETPEAVQQAVSAGLLPRTLAFRVGLLPVSAQNEIADRIASGEVAKSVAREVLHRLARRRLPVPGTPAAEYRKLLTTARRVLRIVAGHEAEVVGCALGSSEAVRILQRLSEFAREMARAEELALQSAIADLRARVLRP